MVYSNDFYATVRDGARESAQAVVPLVRQLIRAHTVVDVGCGEGWWAHEFAQGGAAVVGVDSRHLTSSPLDRATQFVAHDLTEPLPLPAFGGFDLAVCLEVGEHLPAARADGLVADLCALAPVVLWSAAIPGQGGAGHVNEQWPDYWVQRFTAHGMTVSGALRWMIWDDERVENWYRQNLLVAARVPDLYPLLFDTELARPWPVVHPILFQARRS